MYPQCGNLATSAVIARQQYRQREDVCNAHVKLDISGFFLFTLVVVW